MMSETDHTVVANSLLYNTSGLVQRVAPRSGLARLGAWWGFWSPDRAHDPWESSLPEGPGGLIAALESRTGIRIHANSGFEALRAAARVRPVICAVDSFYLPYRPAYGRVHSHRTVVLERGEPARVWVIDDWPPRHQGWLSWTVLAAACEAEVPLVLEQEPVFAGGALHSQWWSVDVDPLVPVEVGVWTRQLLEALCDDHAHGADGATAVARTFESFTRRAMVDATPADRRHQALTLRANLGPRSFLVRLLHAAADWIDTPELRGCAAGLARGVAALKLCGDLLIKLTRYEDDAYPGLLEDSLRRVAATEAAVHRCLTRIIVKV